MRQRCLSGIALLLTSLVGGCANRTGEGETSRKPTSDATATTPAAAVRTAARTGTARLVSDRYQVTAARAPLYFFGPAQPKGPDLGLVKGSKVTMIKPDKLFSQVKTDHGFVGYVATEYLKQLPPEQITVLPGGLPEFPAFHPGGGRRPQPELQVVPLDIMLSEPPLPSSDAAIAPAPLGSDSLIPTEPALPEPVAAEPETPAASPLP